MKKRLLSLLMALLLVLTLVPTAAFAGKSETDVEYPVTGGSIWFDKSTGTVTECDTSVTEATIPADIDGVAVKSIGEMAFQNRCWLTSVTLSEGITSIDEYAFRDCKYLTSVTLPKSLTSIGEKAFYKCEELTSVTLPDSLTSIGISAFDNCRALESIDIPAGVKSIAASAFFNCEKLASVTLHEGLESIGSSTFRYCEALTSITLPESLKTIDSYAFADTGLTTVTLPATASTLGDLVFSGKGLTAVNVAEGNANYCSADGILFSKDMSTLLIYPAGKTDTSDYTIPDSVTRINIGAFAGCDGILSVTIPAGLEELTYRTFETCYNLAAINVAEGNANYRSLDGVVFNKAMSKLVTYPIGKADASYTIPDGVTELAESAFYCSANLTSVTVPAGITSIPNSCFQACKKLTTVHLPQSLNTVDYYAFYVCNSLTTVYYEGTKEEWSNVTINGEDNDKLKNAAVYYLGEPHEHSYDGTWSADAEYHWQQCSDINCPNKALSIKEKTAHSFEWVIDKEASTTKEGLQHEECSVCGYKRSENTVIHSYDGTWRYDSTGHWQQCSDSSCADYYSSIKNKAAHSSFKWVIDREPSTSEEGLKHEECTVCGYKQSIDTVISKLPLYAAEVEDVSLTLRTGYTSSDIYALGDARLVKITNTGNQDLSAYAVSVNLTGSGADNFELRLDATPGIIIVGDTNTSWYIHPKTGLAAGTYTATIEFKDAGDMMSAPVTATVTLTVTDAEPEPEPPTHEHSYDGTWSSNAEYHWHGCSDSSCTDYYSSIKNSAKHSFEWVIDKEASTSEEGLKHEECTVCGYKRNENTVISKLPLYAAEVEDVSLTLRTGYNSSDIYALGDARLVKITNTGNQDLSTNGVSVTLTGSGADNFELNLGPVPSVIGVGATDTSWYIHPKTGLAAGTYTATIKFEDVGNMLSAPVTATVTLTVTEHPFDTTKWEHDSRTHWNPCADADCSVRGNEAAHDNAVVKDAKAATFDTDGYSGDKYCSVCGERVETGKATAALKYIRESKAFMTPAALSADICANDLVFSSAEPEKYSVALWRVFDLTDTSLNTDSKQYPKDAKFVAGHKYAIEFKFTAVGSYVYDEMHSDYWSSFTLNGEETKLSAAVSVGGSTNRCVELTATDGTELPEVLPGDLNGDGKIDVADLIRLKKYIAGDSVELKTSGDLNDDGDINIADLIRLKKYIAGDSVTLH